MAAQRSSEVSQHCLPPTNTNIFMTAFSDSGVLQENENLSIGTDVFTVVFPSFFECVCLLLVPKERDNLLDDMAKKRLVTTRHFASKTQFFGEFWKEVLAL